MKKIKNLVIGGIESKVLLLIIATMFVITAAFMGVSIYHNNNLVQLVNETTARQQASMTEITDSVMQTVVEQSMGRTTVLESMVANELFQDLATRVELMADYAQKVFSEPGAWSKKAVYAGPDAARDGEVTSQMILAEGVDDTDPAVAEKLGLAAGMSDMMMSMFTVSDETNSLFVALPEGAMLMVDDDAGGKFDEAGNVISFDPRTRPWYAPAVEAGGLIFSDVMQDAFTGEIEIVCAKPVYVGGELAAVVGSDLFLTNMRAGIQSSDENGGFLCVVNQNGHVVFSPKEEGTFRVARAEEAEDLRASDNAELAALVADAMRDRTDVRLIALEEGNYYMMGAPLGSIGWALISVFDEAATAEPARMLETSYQTIEQEATEAYKKSTDHSRTTLLVLLGVLTLGLIANALVQGKRIVKPLNRITKRISELREGDLEFKMEDAFRTGDEIEVLADSFASLSHKTVGYVEQVRQVTAEKERVSLELQLSHDIQINMLPNIFPAFPDRREFDIYASMDPAKEVGGDFYDFFLTDESHLVMVIADVSGKGIPAAMFMMASKIIINNISTLGVSDPAKILEAANRQITSNNPGEMFVTVWLGILNINTGLLVAANGGHEYPCLMRAGGGFEIYRDRHGFVLGGMEGSKYRSYELQLYPGDAIFVYTDGVAEATNDEDELFGLERLKQALNRHPDASCRELLENVTQAVGAFVEDAPQFDDTTMLAVRYFGAEGRKDDAE